MKPEQVQIPLEPPAFSLNSANIVFGEEEFVLILVSGTSARQYHASPKHAKRLSMLLQRQIEAYEGQFGVLQTELPQATETTKPQFGFQPPEPEQSPEKS